jgi:hypothetical protein
VIKVLDKRPAWQTVKFDDIKEELVGGLTIVKQRSTMESLFDSLQAKAKVEQHLEALK